MKLEQAEKGDCLVETVVASIARIASARRHARVASGNNVRFRFHLARRGGSPDTPYGSRRSLHDDGAFAGRKLSSMIVLCSVYREHIARRTQAMARVKAGHAMKARAPLLYPFRTSSLLCVVGKTGSGCQLSTTRTNVRDDRRRPDPSSSEFEKARFCVVLMTSGFLSRREYIDMQSKLQRVHKYSID